MSTLYHQRCSLSNPGFLEIRVTQRPKKLLDQVRDVARPKRYSSRNERAYALLPARRVSPLPRPLIRPRYRRLQPLPKDRLAESLGSSGRLQ